MHHEGASHGFIGRCLNISQPTLRTYLLEYQLGGLERVLEDRSYRPSSSLEPFWQCLKCSFAAAPLANAKMAVQRIEQLTGIRLSKSQCRRTTKRMGMSLKKSAPLPGKIDEQLQLEFYPQEMTPRLVQAAKGERKVCVNFLPQSEKSIRTSPSHSSWTTHATNAVNWFASSLGDWTSNCSSYPPTAPISILSNACGSWSKSAASPTATTPPSPTSATPSTIASTL